MAIGTSLIAVGCGLIWLPLALIVGGGLVIGLSVLAIRINGKR